MRVGFEPRPEPTPRVEGTFAWEDFAADDCGGGLASVLGGEIFSFFAGGLVFTLGF